MPRGARPRPRSLRVSPFAVMGCAVVCMCIGGAYFQLRGGREPATSDSAGDARDDTRRVNLEAPQSAGGRVQASGDPGPVGAAGAGAPGGAAAQWGDVPLSETTRGAPAAPRDAAPAAGGSPSAAVGQSGGTPPSVGGGAAGDVVVPTPSQEPTTAVQPAATGTDAPALRVPVAEPPQQIDPSSMTAFVNTGGRFPVVVLTANRDALLDRTLQSLLEVRGVDKDLVTVVQDGSMESVAAVVRRHGLRVHQHDADTNLRGGKPRDGARRIAEHYAYALTYMFDHSDAPAIIVAEDDFMFAPDFLEYFLAVAPVLEADPTVFLASAWNDNGFAGRTRDLRALRRTGFFPGLGWLLPREVYRKELEPSWPHEHWDHWLRDPARHKNRDIVTPEVPRTYHIGVKGTFMNRDTHNQYFASINLNRDPNFSWLDTAGKPVDTSEVIRDHYDRRLKSLIESGTVLSSFEDLEALTSGVGVMYIRASITNQQDFRSIAAYFHLWHEILRGSYHGTHEFWWQGEAKVILVNEREAKPQFLESRGGARVFRAAEFVGRQPPEAAARLARTPTLSAAEIAGSPLQAAAQPAAAGGPGGGGGAYDIVPSPTAGLSCTDVCATQQKQCAEYALRAINSCANLKNYFACTGCRNSMGGDQPAMVETGAPSNVVSSGELLPSASSIR